jgi:hypothetical protein
MKLSISIIILLLTFSVNSNEIKLSCQSQFKGTVDTKIFENKSGVLIVEVSDNNRDLVILTDGLYETSVSTYLRNGKEINNYSNLSKWDILNTYSPNDKFKQRSTRIMIDRNTGFISITQFANTYDGIFIENRLTGNCSKVDSTQRKF